jgi:outer membrane receptor protein involved in Fe transport
MFGCLLYGVINIITKRPEKPFSAQAEVVGGSYGYNKEKCFGGREMGTSLRYSQRQLQLHRRVS